MTDPFEKLGKKVQKLIFKEYDEEVDLTDILEWFSEMDEDELVSSQPEDLADWFMEH